MGNSESSEVSQFKFFWRSDPDPFSPQKNSTWTPYDEGDSQFLEEQFQLYLQNKNPEVLLGTPPKYKIDFKKWLQINLNETWRQRPIKRDLPSNMINIVRFNRFDADVFHKDQPKIQMINEDDDFGQKINKVTLKKEGFITKTFGIIPNKEVEVLIPENLDFLPSEQKIVNYKEYVFVLK